MQPSVDTMLKDAQNPRYAVAGQSERGAGARSAQRTGAGLPWQLKRIGEDVAQKLDYMPGVFTVERHVRGKWACAQCQSLTQAPVAAHIIDKGIPTTGLLAQVLVAKYLDHQPLYRQENIFGRAGLAIPRSTLAQWVGTCGARLQPLVDALNTEVLGHRVMHSDETPVAMLKPGNGKTHRAYLWAYAPGAFEDMKAVVYDFCESRAGEHVRAFLGESRGSLICDDYAGYKASFSQGVTEAGCLAHARRKFFDLHVAGNSAKALDYSLKRWSALTRFVDDPQLPPDNNWIENQIRPVALGRSNWLFAGSLRAGQRAAAVMSLIQSARMNGHDPYAYLKDVLTRLPTQKASRINELLPHRWKPGASWFSAMTASCGQHGFTACIPWTAP